MSLSDMRWLEILQLQRDKKKKESNSMKKEQHTVFAVKSPFLNRFRWNLRFWWTPTSTFVFFQKSDVDFHILVFLLIPNKSIRFILSNHHFSTDFDEIENSDGLLHQLLIFYRNLMWIFILWSFYWCLHVILLFFLQKSYVDFHIIFLHHHGILIAILSTHTIIGVISSGLGVTSWIWMPTTFWSNNNYHSRSK